MAIKKRTSKILPVIGISTLGCPKNLVDTENIAGILYAAGYQITTDHAKADISLVNTCTFIKDSNNESREVLNDLSRQGQKLIITGCMAQRFKGDLFSHIPGTQAVIGTGNIPDILSTVKKVTENLNKGKKSSIMKADAIPNTIATAETPRLYTQIGPSAYIKIADGCNHKCTFCIIPYLRGNMRSRTIEDIVKEAQKLVKYGVKELILISQDSTAYGSDIYKRRALADLLREMADKSGAKWIRLMYAYPTEITKEMLTVIKEKENIVKYIDIPLQHASPKILKLMHRPSSVKNTVELIKKHLPRAAIRTTFIVGFPGETEKDFKELYNFVKETKFDRVGVFTYSQEESTLAFNFDHQLPEKIKQERRDKIMRLQQRISLEKNKEFIGKETDMLIEYVEHPVEMCSGVSPSRIVGRSYRDAPEIDGQLYIDIEPKSLQAYEPTKKNPLPGDFIKVKIVNCDEYDLFCKLL